MLSLLQGQHPLYRNLPGARHNVQAYGRAPQMAGGGRVMAGRPMGAGPIGPGVYGGSGAAMNKRKVRPGSGEDDYGRNSGRFGGQLDREMQFFEKVRSYRSSMQLAGLAAAGWQWQRQWWGSEEWAVV